jgi:hypothetical protein
MMMKMEGNGFHPIMNIMEVVLTLPMAKRTPFNWMYIDYNTLQNAAANGLQAELILEGNIMIFLRSCQFRNKEKRLANSSTR